MEEQQRRVVAIVDYLEDLVAAVTPPEFTVPWDRLLEDAQICRDLDRGMIPLGMVFAASATLDKREVQSFSPQLASLLGGDVLASLDRVAETLLMITEAEVRASGAVATSVLVQQALPGSVPGSPRVLSRLLEMVDQQYKKRAIEHSEVFGPLARLEGNPTMAQLPTLLAAISDGMEDLACERGLFLDNPVELVPKEREEEPISAEEDFKQARLESAVDIGSLSEELEQIGALSNLLGWTRERALRLVSDLYRRKAMDARTKVGLSVASICKVIEDLTASLEVEVNDVGIEDEARADVPYRYEWDLDRLVLHLSYRGGISSNSVKDAHEGILERLRQEQADRKATALEKAVDRWRAAREPLGDRVPPEEEGLREVEALGELFGLLPIESYDAASALYGIEGLRFSTQDDEGVSIAGLIEFLRPLVEPGEISRIALDPEYSGLVPFRVDREQKTFFLHPSVQKITDRSIRSYGEDHSIEPQPLVTPSEERKIDYRDPDLPGSLADERNAENLIEEFGLHEEHAPISLEVLLEGNTACRETISVQTMRILLATLNERLGGENRIDVVTGCSRDDPETQRTDTRSVAWIETHEEPGLFLRMFAINFDYGERKSQKLPPLSDQLLLDWCRHEKIRPASESVAQDAGS